MVCLLFGSFFLVCLVYIELCPLLFAWCWVCSYRLRCSTTQSWIPKLTRLFFFFSVYASLCLLARLVSSSRHAPSHRSIGKRRSCVALHRFSSFFPTLFLSFVFGLSYRSGQYDSPEDFQRLDAEMRKVEGSSQRVGRLLYLALPPDVFLPCVENYRKACWNDRGTQPSFSRPLLLLLVGDFSVVLSFDLLSPALSPRLWPSPVFVTVKSLHYRSSHSSALFSLSEPERKKERKEQHTLRETGEPGRAVAAAGCWVLCVLAVRSLVNLLREESRTIRRTCRCKREGGRNRGFLEPELVLFLVLRFPCGGQGQEGAR